MKTKLADITHPVGSVAWIVEAVQILEALIAGFAEAAAAAVPKKVADSKADTPPK